MMYGNERRVLDACNDLPKDSAGFVDEAEIAHRTQLQLQDVRDCIESLDEKGWVTSARLTDRFKARITADGRQELRRHKEFPEVPRDRHLVEVVPQGLRPFDAQDADSYLELLPDYRGQDRLPAGINFWKIRIEGTNRDQTLRVGVIYGLSGCGKTSLIKAGVLPKLADHVLQVVIKATANNTEVHLLNVLRERCLNLPTGLKLEESFEVLHHDDRVLPPGKTSCSSSSTSSSSGFSSIRARTPSWSAPSDTAMANGSKPSSW